MAYGKLAKESPQEELGSLGLLVWVSPSKEDCRGASQATFLHGLVPR